MAEDIPVWRAGRADLRRSISHPGLDEPFEYYVAWSPGDNKVSGSPYFQYERLILAGKSIFERSANAWVTSPGQGKPSVDPSKLYLSAFPTNTEAVLAYTAWTSGIGWHDFPANVFMQPAKGGGLFGGGGDNAQSNGLDDTAANYLQVLREVTQNLRDQVPRRHILARVKQINPSVAAIELDDVLKPTKSRWHPRRRGPAYTSGPLAGIRRVPPILSPPAGVVPNAAETPAHV